MKEQKIQKFIYIFALLFASCFLFLPAQASVQESQRKLLETVNNIEQQSHSLFRHSRRTLQEAKKLIQRADNIQRQNINMEKKINRQGSNNYQGGYTNYNLSEQELKEVGKLIKGVRYHFGVLLRSLGAEANEQSVLKSNVDNLINSIRSLQQTNEKYRADLQNLKNQHRARERERRAIARQEGEENLKKVKKWFQGGTPPPKLRINGVVKEYPAGKEGWRRYWRDKNEQDMRNSR